MSDYLPPEVVAEILASLPVKSLLRFRCVCKDWLSLISSSDFISKHLSNSSSYHTLVRHYTKLKELYTIYDANGIQRTRFNSPMKLLFYHRVVGYCNGVLCLSDDLFGYKETIILWNPSIRREINVPTARVTTASYGSYKFALGFGFDFVSKDYKIVRVAYLVDDRCVVEVYSVSLGEWRFVESNIAAYIPEYIWSQAVRDSIVHWVGFKASREARVRSLIVTFDLSTEIFGELSLPGDLERISSRFLTVSMLRGSLVVLWNRLMIQENCCKIWIMKDYGNVESWVNQYNVDLEGALVVVGMLRNNMIAVGARNGELVTYNYEDGTSIRKEIFGTRFSFFADRYVESLVLMGKGREIQGRDQKLYIERNADIVVERQETRQLYLAFRNIQRKEEGGTH